MKNITFDADTKEQLLKIILSNIHKLDKINKTENISAICESVNSKKKNESVSTLYNSKYQLSEHFNFSNLNVNDMDIDYEPEMKLSSSKKTFHDEKEEKENNIEPAKFEVRKDYGSNNIKNEDAQDVNSSDDEDDSEEEKNKTRRFFETQLGIDVY